MESSIAVFLMRRLACEQPPTLGQPSMVANCACMGARSCMCVHMCACHVFPSQKCVLASVRIALSACEYLDVSAERERE